MEHFTCTEQQGGQALITEAESHQDAAQKAAQIFFNEGGMVDLHVQRTTGDVGKSGYFAVYIFAEKLNCYLHTGLEMHVS